MFTCLFAFKSLLSTPSNVLPLYLKQTFPPIIGIFTEGESDGMESRLPFKSFLLYQFSALVEEVENNSIVYLSLNNDRPFLM